MPHSLRSKLSGLRYKKIITDKEYERLKNSLDTVDAIKKIKEKINYEAECYIGGSYGDGLYKALEIIDESIKEEQSQSYQNDLACVGCAYSGNRFRVCSFCFNHNKYETNPTFGVDDHTVISEIKKIMSRQFIEETNKISYGQALDGMKSEYPTGKELDAFLEYKRDKKEAKNDNS